MLTLALVAALLAPAGAGEGLRFLEGDWVSVESSGEPGQASGGGFSLHRELDGKVLVRRNRAEYPAREGRPAFVHEDLMVVYADAARAIYFDNEGHVIRYRVQADGNTATFLSEPEAGAPQYRLTYRTTGADTISIRFELAPPGKPFQKYVEAGARRK